MWLLPYEHFFIRTHLSQDEIIQKLRAVTDTSRRIVWFPSFSSKQHKLYLGKINETSFSFYRWIHHRDSFLPVIDGNFLSQHPGSTIRIRMHLHWLVTILMTLFLGYFGLQLLVEIWHMIVYFLQSSSLPTDSIVGLGLLSVFFFFGYGMMIFGFKIDTRREKKSIVELMEAYDIVEVGIFDADRSSHEV